MHPTVYGSFRTTLEFLLSIQVNAPWRLIVLWNNGSAFDVELIDYH